VHGLRKVHIMRLCEWRKLMKVTILHAAISTALGITLLSAPMLQAATLNFDDGVRTTTTFTYNGNSFTETTVSGSWFALDSNDDGTFSSGEQLGISQENGVIVDNITPQIATGSHGGEPGCVNAGDPTCTNTGENPTIDNPWLFLSNTGMHTAGVISVVSNDFAGNVELDFTEWGLIWNTILIPLAGDPANFGEVGNTGLAVMTCAVDGVTANCASGTDYTLDYFARVEDGDPSNFGGVFYGLHLEGTLSGELPAAVPVPAAVWLFGSGILGLLGVFRRE